MERVCEFALAIARLGVPVRTQPAWLVSRDHDNEYNNKTRLLLFEFEKLGITQNEGNIVFPGGRAVEYFSEYFVDNIQNPYEQDPYNVQTISISPDGSVLRGNVYESDILDIIESYVP
jgi:hypothetical protein